MPKAASNSNPTHFSKAYAMLDIAQKKAVDTIHGPVMVIAGPGTGKTHIMALRIANILDKTDTAPTSILALTFTESAVTALRKRLASIIGETAYRIPIYTFHGFCNTVIARFPEKFDRIIGATSASDVDQLDIIRLILKKGNFLAVRPLGDPYYYVKAIIGTITELKREAILPGEFKKILAKDEAAYERAPDKIHTKGAHKGKIKSQFTTWKTQIEKNRELLAVFEQYEKELRRRALYDYDDTIIETIKVIAAHEDVRLTLQEEYQFVLADEHQDANASQNTLLELLTSYDTSPNLFIVGDDKQAIFRFQGASLENFLYFQKKFPSAKRVSLATSYRSTQTILDTAHSLAQGLPGNESVARTRLASLKKQAKPVAVVACANPEHEANYVAEDIAARLKKNPALTAAVIFRENAESDLFAQALAHRGIAYEQHHARELFREPFFAFAIALLKAALAPTDSAMLGELLFAPFWHISPLDAHAVLSAARSERRPLYEVLAKDKRESIKKFMKALTTMSAVAQTELLRTAFTTISIEARLPQFLAEHPEHVAHDIYEALAREVLVFVERTPKARLSDFISYIDTLIEQNISLKTRGTAGTAQVSLLTAHRSKGLEFDVVYVVGLTDRRWGGKVQRKSFVLPLVHADREHMPNAQDDSDERRLLYVALTRGKDHVTITHPEARLDGTEEIPSRFIGELDKELISFEKAPAIKTPLVVSKPASRSAAYKKIIAEHLARKGISPTSLGRYLNCPWEFIFIDVMGLPEPSSVHQHYGIAVHSALRQFFDKFSAGKRVSAKDLLSYFDRALMLQPLLDDDFKRIKKRGREVLKGLYDTRHTTWIRDSRTEVRIQRIVLPGIDAFLTGTIDKIETLPDGSVAIIDYKVRKPTAITPAYARQLAFYKLLVEQHQHNTVRTTRIEFIEPSKKGDYQHRLFEVTPEVTTELRESIKRMITELESVSFWNNRCENADCKYCRLAASLSLPELPK